MEVSLTGCCCRGSSVVLSSRELLGPCSRCSRGREDVGDSQGPQVLPPPQMVGGVRVLPSRFQVPQPHRKLASPGYPQPSGRLVQALGACEEGGCDRRWNRLAGGEGWLAGGRKRLLAPCLPGVGALFFWIPQSVLTAADAATDGERGREPMPVGPPSRTWACARPPPAPACCVWRSHSVLTRLAGSGSKKSSARSPGSHSPAA